MTLPQRPTRTIVKKIVPSFILPEERTIRICLPPGYDENQTYPVIYAQDGEQFFNYARAATLLSELITKQEIQPAVLVGVDVDLALRTAEYAPSGERFEDYCAFFSEELLPFVEAQFSVARQPEGRILAGASLGACVSLHLALDEPDLYHRLLLFSGAYLPETLDRIKREQQLTQMELYTWVGLQETAVSTNLGTLDFVQLSRECLGLLAERHASIDQREMPGEHTWGYWQEQLPDALRYFLK